MFDGVATVERTLDGGVRGDDGPVGDDGVDRLGGLVGLAEPLLGAIGPLGSDGLFSARDHGRG